MTDTHEADRFRPRCEGEVTYADRYRVEGWVLDLDDPGKPLRIEVLVDEQVAWAGIARRLHCVELDDQQCILPAGFKVDLGHVPIDAAASVTVRVAATGNLLRNCPATIQPESPYEGYVDFVSPLIVGGWVWDRTQPLAAVPVKVLAPRGEATGYANLYREDLAGSGKGAGTYGFQIAFPERLSNEELKHVRVLTQDGTYELSMEPVRYEVANETGAVDAPSEKPTQAVFEGYIDGVQGCIVHGWARNSRTPDVPVLVDIFVNDSLIGSSWAVGYRRDLAAKFADDGRCAFQFELPAALLGGREMVIDARPRNRSGQMKRSPVRAPPHVAGKVLGAECEASWLNALRFRRRAPRREQSEKVSIIVLNLNGAGLMDRFLRSFAAHNSHEAYEILVIDHGSDDDSKSVVDQWMETLRVRWIPREGNYSFSQSNNLGAHEASGDYILFANNDIEFCQDILSRIVEYLDGGAGVVGVKLLDAFEDGQPSVPPAIQHLGVHFDVDAQGRGPRPYEMRYVPHLAPVINMSWCVPAVTGALLGCRKADFVKVGGFSEEFFYGYEDVDFCLRMQNELDKHVVCANDLTALHARGYSRSRIGSEARSSIEENGSFLFERLGYRLRRNLRRDLFNRAGFWSGRPTRVAFAVTQVGESAAAGDYFTACELGEELRKQYAVEVRFLEKDTSWHELRGIDVLIVMRDDYDLRKIRGAPRHLLKVGWARNWFERWTTRPWTSEFDLLWSSSQLGANLLEESTGKHVSVVRLATNWKRFSSPRSDPAHQCDYCFTGSFWKAPRDIMFLLEPQALPFKFALFGSGWGVVPTFKESWRGFVPYGEIDKVYAGTKVVVDDANTATKEWGSVNSRVFDALASGALVVSNGEEGAREVFAGLLPTYSSRHELEDLLWEYLTDESKRQEKVTILREEVRQKHTYAVRAREVHDILRRHAESTLRVAIKCAAPSAVAYEWGDYHFAIALKRALERRGIVCRVDCRGEWTCEAAAGDDAVLVLRGLVEYTPRPDQINIMWNISHPDRVSQHEYEQYDLVFVASESYAGQLQGITDVPVRALLQCTDPSVFFRDEEPLDDPPDVLFVGNSRNVFRPIVRDALSVGIPVAVYGTRWERFVPSHLRKGSNILNSDLRKYYSSCSVLLNDHWESMREHGFLSNRLFDAVACQARVISDRVAGIRNVFGDAVEIYDTPGDLAHLISKANGRSDHCEDRPAVAERVRREHSFDARAEVIKEVLWALHEERMGIRQYGHAAAREAAVV